MMKSGDLESQLRKWREDRARKQSERPGPIPNDRRTLRVNGQEVVVVTKPKRSASVG
jgi:hypothetical protein